MKKIFLLAGIASFSVAAAQNDQLPKVQAVPPKPKENVSSVPKFYVITPKQQLIANAKLLNTLPNGNKVYALPQDNMPCVVPNVVEFNMPVVTPQKEEAYTIPNPAYPPAAKPAILTEEQMKQLMEKQLSERKRKPR
ncbi:MAG: hypothetical protein WDO16_06135 [Bacteroidota bacterium]